jgi:hypothetical protein
MVDRSFVLDTGVVIAFQRAGELNLLAHMGSNLSLVMVEEVRDELLGVPSKRAHFARELQGELIDPGRLRVESMLADDPATEVLRLLRRGRMTATDLGEDASIAWASTRPEAWMVLRDRRAAMLALEELRGRTLGLFGFLAAAADSGAADRDRVKAAGSAMTDTPALAVRAPTWWADF